MDNVIEIKGNYSHDEFVYFHYENIICLAEVKWLYNTDETQRKIYFYDVRKSMKVDLYGWCEKLENYSILDIYPIKTCIFIIAEHSDKYILICLDLKNKIWKECFLPDKMYLKCDTENIYLQSLSKESDCYIVRCTLSDLSIIGLNFFNGIIKEFEPHYIYENKLILTISGEDTDIFDKNQKLIKKFSAFQTILCYDGNSADIIDINDDKEITLSCISVSDNIIYYAYLKNETEDIIYKYDLKNNKKSKIILDKEEYAVSSENEIYICSKKYIKRISDNKVIAIEKIKSIMNKFRYSNRIKWNPEYWYFYDHWIEIEIPDMRVFVLNIETMQSYYFENKMQIKNNYIYSFGE